MGMQQLVIFEGDLPAWSAVCKQLQQAGATAPGMRMIDGEIALPDEQPPADWGELRVAWPEAGMVTVQRESERQVTLVVWGNADASLQAAWHWLTWAFAAARAGEVEAEGQRYDADGFAEAKSLTG